MSRLLQSTAGLNWWQIGFPSRLPNRSPLRKVGMYPQKSVLNEGGITWSPSRLLGGVNLSSMARHGQRRRFYLRLGSHTAPVTVSIGRRTAYPDTPAILPQRVLSDVYAENVNALGPSAYWRFNDSLGPVIRDESPNSNHGTYATTGVAFMSESAIQNYPINKAVAFDGANGYGQVPDSTTLRPETGNKFSWVGWVKFASTNNNNLPRIWEKGPHYLSIMGDSGNGRYRQFALEVQNTTGLGNANGGAAEFWGNTRVDVGEWYHIAVTFDGGLASNHGLLYVNGYPEIMSEIFGWPASPNHLLDTTIGDAWQIGRSTPDLLFTMNGEVDDSAFYDGRVLTAAQIKVLYRASRIPQAVTGTMNDLIAALAPIAHWHLGDPSGAVADDPIGGYDGAYAGTHTLAQAGIGDGSLSTLFSGGRVSLATPIASLDTPFNPAEGSLLLCLKIANAGVWTDGTADVPANFGVDGSNRFFVEKLTTSNQIRLRYLGGGVPIWVDFIISTTEWFQLVMTWKVSTNEFRVYFNGQQIGGTQTPMPTWVGALSAGSLMDVDMASSVLPWLGNGAKVALWNVALTPTQVRALAPDAYFVD